MLVVVAVEVMFVLVFFFEVMEAAQGIKQTNKQKREREKFAGVAHINSVK